jgi:hypothetical protein
MKKILKNYRIKNICRLLNQVVVIVPQCFNMYHFGEVVQISKVLLSNNELLKRQSMRFL